MARSARDLVRLAGACLRRWAHCLYWLARFSLKHREVDIWLKDGGFIAMCECGKVFYRRG